MRIVLCLASLFLTACQRLPEVYAPPEQRHPSEGNIGIRASMMINMNDPTAPEHFVQDIGSRLEAGYWRWTGKRPTLKILLVKTRNIKFSTDFTLYEGCMRETGPVTITFFIGDRVLDKLSFNTPGYKHFEKPVNGDWLQTATPTLLAAEIDKLYRDPGDGRLLGFILTKMGFERE